MYRAGIQSIRQKYFGGEFGGVNSATKKAKMAHRLGKEKFKVDFSILFYVTV